MRDPWDDSPWHDECAYCGGWYHYPGLSPEASAMVALTTDDVTADDVLAVALADPWTFEVKVDDNGETRIRLRALPGVALA